MSRHVPKYRLHRSSGQALVQIAGRRIYLGKHNSQASLERYRRLTAEWLKQQDSPTKLPAPNAASGGLSVSELVLQYFHHAEQYYVRDGKPTKEVSGIRAALRLVVDRYGLTPASDFGPLALKSVLEAMVSMSPATKRPWTRTGINKQLYRIRRAFKWAVSQELIAVTQYQSLLTVESLRFGRTEAPETAPVEPVPDAWVTPVLEVVSPPVAAMMQLQRLTGMRSGEVVIMRAVDLDRTRSVWVYRPQRHKTQYRGERREVFLGPKAQRVLAPFLNRPCDAYLFSPREAELHRNQKRRSARRSPMTPSQARRRPSTKPARAKRPRYDVDSYRRAIAYGIAKAGVPHWHPHQIRHTVGTEIREAHGVEAAQAVLGHKHLSTTEIYAKVQRELATQVMAETG